MATLHRRSRPSFELSEAGSPLQTLRGLGAEAVAAVRRHSVAILAAVVAVVIVVAGVGLAFPAAIGREPTRTVVADFVEAPGLYTDNSVDILGVPTGHVTSVRASAGHVRVTMELPRSTRIPSDVRAILMAPNPVSDRTIELYPPWTGQPQLADGATIPLSRTAVPLGVDQVFAAIDNLAKTLGPDGANSGGALSQTLKSLADLTRGNGADLQNTLAALASALPAFTADPGRISELISNLDTLTRTLADRSATIDRFFASVAAATGDLAGERATLASAIGNLQAGIAQVSAFVSQNRASLTGAVADLATTGKALVRDQNALITTFGTAALGFQNLNRAIDVTAPCAPGTGRTGACPVVFGRITLPTNIQSVVQTYCKSALQEGLPIVVQTFPGIKTLGINGVTTADAINTLCVNQYAVVQGHSSPRGAPAGPDLGLGRFLK